MGLLGNKPVLTSSVSTMKLVTGMQRPADNTIINCPHPDPRTSE